MMLPCLSWFAVGFVVPKLLGTAIHALDGLQVPLLHLPALNAASVSALRH